MGEEQSAIDKKEGASAKVYESPKKDDEGNEGPLQHNFRKGHNLDSSHT